MTYLKLYSLLFLRYKKNKEWRKDMNKINFTSLQECISCYGRKNLIPIDRISQIIFYTAHGCQPKYICENELKPGKLSAWFLKSETNYIYQKWMENKPE